MVAKEYGYTLFSVQHGGQCFASRGGKMYQQYGRTTRCRNGKGAGWANDVYRINKGKIIPSRHTWCQGFTFQCSSNDTLTCPFSQQITTQTVQHQLQRLPPPNHWLLLPHILITLNQKTPVSFSLQFTSSLRPITVSICRPCLNVWILILFYCSYFSDTFMRAAVASSRRTCVGFVGHRCVRWRTVGGGYLRSTLTFTLPHVNR